MDTKAAGFRGGAILRLPELVSYTVHILNDGGLAVRINLGAQSSDVRAYSVWRDVGGRGPDPLQQCISAKDLIRVLDEKLEQ